MTDDATKPPAKAMIPAEGLGRERPGVAAVRISAESPKETAVDRAPHSLAETAARPGDPWKSPAGNEAGAIDRPMIASDLDRAGKGQLVYVGRDGEVKSPQSVRNRQIAAYVTFGGITVAGVALAASTFPVLVPFYLALGGRFFATVRAYKRVNEASVALSKGDAAGGRALAQPVSRAWWAPARVRALAELRVAVAEALEGNGEQALHHLRHARANLPRRLIQHQFSYYTEINVLTALGRTKEARAVLESCGGVPNGEVLKLSYWIAQMHLWVAENPAHIDLDDAELHDRMRKGLSMTAGADLLMLCAWAYARRGEHDEARFAWRQSREREGSQRLDIAMPALAAWMREYEAQYPDIDQADPDDLDAL